MLKFSAIEIYNEVVRDLLSSESTSLRLWDDAEVRTLLLVFFSKSSCSPELLMAWYCIFYRRGLM